MQMEPETIDRKSRTVAELRRELDRKAARIQGRLQAIGGEMATLTASAPEALLRHPLVATGGALVAGVLVGLVASGLGRRNARRDEVLDVVSAHLVKAVRDHLSSGADAPTAEAPERVSRLLDRLIPIAVDMGLSALGRRAGRREGSD